MGEQKFCKDCRYYSKAKSESGQALPDDCTHPKAWITYTDLVTGVTEEHKLRCFQLRHYENALRQDGEKKCGLEGLWWEPATVPPDAQYKRVTWDLDISDIGSRSR